MRPTCKVCQSGAAAVVDGLLRQGGKLRDIAQQIGLSKSSVHRHSLKCYMRAAAQTLKAKKFDPLRDRTLVKFTDEDSFLIHHAPSDPSTDGTTITSAELRERDVVVKVVFQDSKILNPQPVEQLADDYVVRPSSPPEPAK
jgi:hypothetical protein